LSWDRLVFIRPSSQKESARVILEAAPDFSGSVSFQDGLVVLGSMTIRSLASPGEGSINP